MDGVGPPLVTPFTQEGDLDEPALRELVGWVEQRGVDFHVPCGSNSEAELMTSTERTRVIEIVVEEASVPVLAGTGSPGLRETLEATEAAAAVGADAALVVTPFYFNHDQSTLETYYRAVADAAPLPVYLYSVPGYTDVRLQPETVEKLATHDNIVGMKDSSGDVAEFIRLANRTENADFQPVVGSGSVLAQALDAGGSGGVLALANIAPAVCSEIFQLHQEDPEAARELNAGFVELNRAITATYGIAGLKWAMRARGAPAGHVRSPHQPIDEPAKSALESLIADL
jgi:Dihydrodipicolinate synthase/N-acetylneuraminate lyase